MLGIHHRGTELLILNLSLFIADIERGTGQSQGLQIPLPGGEGYTAMCDDDDQDERLQLRHFVAAADAARAHFDP